MLGRIAVFLNDIRIMPFVHVDEHKDVVLLYGLGYLRVGLEQTAQFMAPPSPIGAELQNQSLLLGFGAFEGPGDLALPVGAGVIELGLFRFLWRFSGLGIDGLKSDEAHCRCQ